MRRKSISFLIAIVFLAVVVGCATWKSNTVKVYRITGITLSQIHETGNEMCSAGTIKAADCAKIKDAYNKTQSVYIAMGDVLILAIKTEDTAKRKAWLTEYQNLLSQFNILSGQLIQLAFDFGILKGGKT